MSSSLSLIWTITAATTLLQAGNGLLQVLMPLRMQAEGLPISAIGIVAAAYGLGFSSGCFLAPVFIRHVGYIRAFASLAAVIAVIVLLMTQVHSTLAWALLRGVSGMVFACIFTATDGWISARAPSSARGRTLSIYMTCTKVALMLSPLGIALGDISKDGLFMAVSAAVSLSLIPIAATSTAEPPAPRAVKIRVRALFSVVPSAVIGVFAVGLINGPVIAITPVFGVSIGMSQDKAAALLFALQAGSLVMQWPLGWLSDRADRRYVIAAIAGATSVMSLSILLASYYGVHTILLFAFAAWGGTSLCLYSVCVAHACDIVEPDQIVSTVGSLLFCWATGVTIGPLLAAIAMDWMGPGGLFIFAAVVSTVLALYVLLRTRLLRRDPLKGGYVDVSPSSSAAASLTPRAEAPQVNGGSLSVESDQSVASATAKSLTPS